MVGLRCTARIRERFNLALAEHEPTSTTRLGAWYVNILNVGPRRLVLGVSEISLLPVLMPARNSEFPERLGEYLAIVLNQLSIPDRAIEAEVAEMAHHAVAKTQSRSVLGVMNDFSRMASYMIDELHPMEVAFRLGDAPVGPLGMASPAERTWELFGVEPVPPF